MTQTDTRWTETANEAQMPAAGLAWVECGYARLGWDFASAAAEAGLVSPTGPANPAGAAGPALVSQSAYARLVRRALQRDPAFAVQTGHHCPFGTFQSLLT